MRKCGENCESICGFCTYYNLNDGKCTHQNKCRELYSNCDCGRFRCFTLDYYYKESNYLTIDYIVKLYEGMIDKDAR